MLSKLLNRSSMTRKNFLIVSILLVNVITWFFLISQMLIKIIYVGNFSTDQQLIIHTANIMAIIGTSIVGTFLSPRINRLKLIYLWIIFGALSSLLPAIFPIFTLSNGLLISIISGASFGLGLPSCLAYFKQCTNFENRGKLSGTSFFFSLIALPLFLSVFEKFNLTLVAIILALWRGSGLVIFFIKPRKVPPEKNNINVSFVSILKEEKFFLYFIPWFTFPIIDGFESIIITNFLKIEFSNLLRIMPIVELSVSGLTVLVAGLFCDLIGRKKIILSGFVALGVAYAIIGFASEFIISWYLYFIVDGFAWGILVLTFFLILWGDLSQPGTGEKYYLMGTIPFFLGFIVPRFFEASSILVNLEGRVTTAFSVASFFLFVAVIPLWFAPETLPEKKIELRRLRSFADDAKKMREKFENKKIN
jgi:MFS family permease